MSAPSLTGALRMARGMRRFLRDAVDPAVALATVAAERKEREARFLSTLDDLVWSIPGSPYHPLLRHAGVEAGDVAALVEERGVDGALVALRDAGVYVTYEEFLGIEPVRRGSLVFELGPERFFNPSVAADYHATTSGTRSGGMPVTMSYRSLVRRAHCLVLMTEMYGATGAPAAVWRPGLPAWGGLTAALTFTKAGSPPEHWFTPLPLRSGGAMAAVANVALPLATRGRANHLPVPRYAPTEDPAAVLRWARNTLDRTGRGIVNMYPSSATHLAHAASARGVRLDGLVVWMLGEPVTAAKADAVRAVGATPLDTFGFTQLGLAATGCPGTPDEWLHVLEHEVAVIPRQRTLPDGSPVDALLWTSLSSESRSAWLNVENDDYGEFRTSDGCGCLLEGMGMTTCLVRVRGISKAVAGGVTVLASDLEAVAETLLPTAFGGSPAHWQLAEREERDFTVLEVRADPVLGALDEGAVRDRVLEYLGRTAAGSVAADLWERQETVVIARRRPRATKNGKVLPFEPLPPPKAT